MWLIKKIKKKGINAGPIWFGRFLELYPPFLFFGMSIKFSKDFHTCKIKLPFRWYLKNGHGSMYGGAILAASDPFPALILSRLIPWAITWTKQHEVIFKKPVRSNIFAEIVISQQELDLVRTALKTHGKFIKTYSYHFYNDKSEEMAEVRSTIYMKNPRHSSFLHSPNITTP
jgi:hypothetical protein